MDQNQIEKIEQQLYRDRGLFFRGTARIRFAHLHFGNMCPREPDRKIIKYLEEKFSNEGCLRLEPMNHIPAIINQKIFDACLAASPRVSQASLLENQDKQPPELRFPNETMIECLQGLHRVAAGKAFLPRRDWWWTVDLYVEDASSDLKTALSEEYANSVNFSDGEIFLKLREYHNEINKHSGTMFAEMRMWGRLSRDKKKDLKQILKHKQILPALDALRAIPALFSGFRIEHRFLPIKCPEEMSNYLLHILQVWQKICGGKKSLMSCLDPQTVRLLQLHAPGCSSHDASVVRRYIDEGKVFPAVQGQDDRRQIWDNIRNLPCLIPSLHSFFDDIKYLHPPAKALRQLIPTSRFSIREAMWRIFTGHNLPENQWLLQTGESENEYQWMQGSASDQFEFSYQQIWLYAWRHWIELVPECPRKEDGEDTPIPQKPDPSRQHGMAKLAAKLGFESDEINGLLSTDPDREIAREALVKARNPACFRYKSFDSYVAEFCRVFNLAEEISPDGSNPPLLVPGSGESLDRRCGRVFDNAYKSDRKHLFLRKINNPTSGEASGLSSFAVRVFVFFAFFGRRLPADGTFTASANSGSHQVLENVGNTGEAPSNPAHCSQNDIESQSSAPSAPIARPGTPVAPISSSSETPIGGGTGMAPQTSDPEQDASIQNTNIADVEMTDFAADPSKLFVKVWADGKLQTYPKTIDMDKAKVEKLMILFDSKGYKLLNARGRCMKPTMVFSELTKNGFNWLVVTLETAIDQKLLAAIRQCIRVEKAVQQQKRKFEEHNT